MDKFLVLTLGKTEEILAGFGIEEEQTPPYVNDFQINEEAFGDYLDHGIEYSNDRARDNDINSVRAIYVLREGKIPHSIEKSIAVFVTTNTSFSKAAFEYGKNFDQSTEVSTVITDFSLANISWLKSPLGAPGLPRKEVLAFAYAALRPSRGFLSKVMQEIDMLLERSDISPRDHQLLRSSYRVQEELMGTTLGDEALITKNSITQTLTLIKDEMVSEEQAERRKVLAELEKEKTDKESLQEAIVWDCTRKAQRKASLVCAVALILLVGIVVLGIYISFNMNKYLCIMYSISSGCLLFASFFYDIKIHILYNYLFKRYKKKYESGFFQKKHMLIL